MSRLNFSNLIRAFLALVIPALLAASYSGTVDAQTPVAPTRSPQEISREASLVGILRSIEKLSKELKAKQEEIRSPSGEGRRDEITQQIQNIVARLGQLQHNFHEISSGVDPEALVSKSEDADVDWNKDLKEILSPILNEVRRLTRRPRELDTLRSAVEEGEAQLALIDQATRTLHGQIDATSDEALKNYLSTTLQEFESRRQAITTQLGISRQKLDKRIAEQQSFSESVHNIFQLFFKSRGLNLALALVCAFAFWLLARRVHLYSSRLFPKRSEERGFYSRLISVLFTLSTIFGAVVVFLFALYFVGDWVLLILALMLILGVIWASKQAVHQFWMHATLLLNMGVAREGERVLYLGVPWLIESLNFYTHLVNPELVGGDVYVPIRDLQSLRSRDFDQREPWFPTSQGDWVRLNDGTVAKILMQTVDIVKLAILGGGERAIPTPKFLEEAPLNLSKGFRHALSFGIDYSHQALATTEIPSAIEAFLREKLAHTAWNQDLTNLYVEFEDAATSSLNLAVVADFGGGAAAEYGKIRRFMARACVEACSENGWTIPFPQLSVHMNPGSSAN